MVVICFKQVLHPSIVATQAHDVVCISEVRHIDIGPDPKPLVILHDPVDNVVEEGRGTCTSLSNAKAYLKRVLCYLPLL